MFSPVKTQAKVWKNIRKKVSDREEKETFVDSHENTKVFVKSQSNRKITFKS